MRKKPLLVVLMGWLYIIGLPIFYYLQIAYYENLAFYDVVSVAKSTYWVYLWLPISSIIVGIGLLNVRMWGWYLFVVHALAIVGWNIYIAIEYNRNPKWMLALFSIITLGIIGVFLRKHIRSPYFNPKVRWWEQEKRFGIFLPTSVKELSNQNFYTGRTFDISASGMFFAGEINTAIGRNVQVKIDSKNLEHFDIEGEVVWVGEQVGKRPAGCGIRYLNIDSKKRRKLRRELKGLDLRRHELNPV